MKRNVAIVALLAFLLVGWAGPREAIYGVWNTLKDINYLMCLNSKFDTKEDEIARIMCKQLEATTRTRPTQEVQGSPW